MTCGSGENHGELRLKNQIRVVFCLDNMRIGGTELNAVRTAEGLDRDRFDIRVVTLQQDGPLRARYDQAGIPVLHLPIANLYGPSTLRQGLRLRRMLSREKIDVFHSHDVYCNIFGGPWARMAGVPAVIESRRWWDSLPRPSLRIANRMAYRWAHCVVANSPAVANLVEHVDGVDRDRIAIIPNFVDEQAFDPLDPAERSRLRERLGVPLDATVVGMIARLAPVKDHSSLLKAMSMLHPRLPDVWCVLVGDGESRHALGREAEALGIGHRVAFAGAQPHHPNLNHLFDVAVLCSRNEGFPNSVVEAMAAGTPVVATAVGGVPDAIDDGVTGRLVPVSNPAALASAIEELVQRPDTARALGAAGQAYARVRHASAEVLGQLGALYHRLLS